MRSPIKVSEYLTAGLGVIANVGIGDFDYDLERDNVAILYEFGHPEFDMSHILSLRQISPSVQGLVCRTRNARLLEKLVSP